MTKYDTNDIIGKKFGRLIPLKEIKKNDLRYVICKCDCGKEVEVKLLNLIRGWTKSCGCLKIDYNRANAKVMGLKNRKVMYCKICGKKHYARGLCKNCYERDRRSKGKSIVYEKEIN